MGKCLFFFEITGSVYEGRIDSHGEVWRLMDGYEVFVIDIHSCDRPWLVS